MKKVNRRNNQKRNELFFIIFFMIMLFLVELYVLNVFFSAKHQNYEYEFKDYTVSAGERLWDIAEEELENNPYYEGDEVRQIIYEIEKDNNISSNQLQAGQVIKIRIKKDGLSSTDQSIDKPTKEN